MATCMTTARSIKRLLLKHSSTGLFALCSTRKDEYFPLRQVSHSKKAESTHLVLLLQTVTDIKGRQHCVNSVARLLSTTAKIKKWLFICLAFGTDGFMIYSVKPKSTMDIKIGAGASGNVCLVDHLHLEAENTSKKRQQTRAKTN